MKKLMLLVMVISCVMLCSCTDEKTARRTLEDQGYTNIELTGYRPWACGDDYTFHTGFKAISIAKKPVTGTVCSGWMKGNSIKTD
jgi:hypothetical protein